MKTYKIEWIEKRRCTGTISLPDNTDPLELSEGEIIGEIKDSGDWTAVTDSNETAIATIALRQEPGNWLPL